MIALPPEIQSQDPPPGASWYAKLLRCLMSMRLSVQPGCGLTLRVGPGGTVVGFNAGPLPFLAITSTAFDAYNASTKKLGVGKVTRHRINVTPAGWFLVPVGGPAIDAGSADPAGLAANRLVQVKIVDGLAIIDVDYCAAGTT